MWLLATLAHAGPDTLLVAVDDPRAPPDLAARGATRVRCLRSSRVCVVDGLAPAAVAGLPGVRRVERDGVMQLAAATGECGPAEPTVDCPDPYELAMVEVEDAWADACGADAPVVAIEDSGFRSTHHDLAGRVASGWDYGDGDEIPEVTWTSGVPEHGTFVAGVIAANEDAAGRTGVAPQSSLFLQKIADASGALYFSYAIEAMDDLAADHPEVGVLNYSIAATSAPQAFADAVAGLGDADIVLVAAAANCPAPNCFDADDDVHPVFPAAYPDPHVLAVASLRADGTLDPYSHFGRSTVDVAAPGAELCSLGVADDSEVLVSSGTSFAAPVAAASVALLRERWPRLTASEAVEATVRGCLPDAELADRIRCGGGLSAGRALDVPVFALDAVDAGPVAPEGELAIGGDSKAAGGSLFVVVTHGPELAVDDPSAVPFAAGDVVPVPGGDEDADGPGTWLVVELPADGPVDVRVPVVARESGSVPVGVRAVPYGGELVGVESSASLTLALALDPPPASSDTAEEDAPAEEPPAGAPKGGGCGCGSAPGGGGALVALIAAWRRRSRAWTR